MKNKKKFESKFIDFDNLKFISICTIIIMIIAHGYCYFNMFFSHDSLRIFHWGSNLTLDSVAIGRYLIPIYLLFRGKFYPPLLIGVLSILFMIIINYLIIDLFKIKNKISCLVIIGIFCTMSSLTLLNATYINYSDMYLLALMLSVLSVYLIRNFKYGYLFGIIPLVVSLGIYQSYLSIFIGLIMLLIILDIFNGSGFKDNFNLVFKSVITCIVSLGVYYILYKVILSVTSISMSQDYNSVSQVGNINGIRNMINLFFNTYVSFINFFIKPSIVHSNIFGIINILILLFIVFMIIYNLIKVKSSLINNILVLVIICLLPFFINVMYFLTNGVVHELMISAFFLIFIFGIKLIDLTSIKYVKYFIILFIVIIVNSIIYANQVYLKKELNFYNTLTTMNRVVDRIEKMDDYNLNTPIVFVGTLNHGDLGGERVNFDNKSVGLIDNFSTTYYDTYRNYFNYFLNYPVKVIEEADVKKYINDDIVKEVNDMNCFPYKDNMRVIDGILYIKLSNYDLNNFFEK